jgi:hypothetical protein
MTDTPRPNGGDVVTYLDMSDPDQCEFRLGIVAGVGVLDPDTDMVWVPIVRPDQEITLIDPGLIVESPDAQRSVDDPSTAVDMLAGALAGLAFDLDELDENQPVALSVAQHLLARFVRIIKPIQDALATIVDAEPAGELAVVLTCIGSAAEEFQQGHVTDGKMGILVANAAMAKLIG